MSSDSVSPAPAPDSNSAAEIAHGVDSKQRESSDPAPSPPAKTSQRGSEEAEHDEPESKSESPVPEASTSAATAVDASTSDGSASSASQPASAAASTPGVASAGDWQAIWSPAHSAYYFYNAATRETTWTNPLQPTASPSASPYPTSAPGAPPTPEASGSIPGSAAMQALYDMQAAAAAQGIDPSLAYLDPSLAAGSSTAPAAFTSTAKFNARSGAFARPDARDPTHLSEYERAKRMSEFYFDVNAWEKDVEMRKLEEAQEQEEGRKRKRPTKKDLERFKEQKRLKKIAKTAWLRT
ncbi:predicted protein [Sparassis crispa]|uniref:WW domain-containing protein n=1 Tax=Sparassis crispa TaxID=139825 RepID=A0A401GMS5_9APHY|nr:predicted protein [Sparassis crispa]GBE83518.1 predicted protein [Sparassis crispa]